MINLITRISVIGIAAITAALVVLLSAFNGIETMIEKLYSDFDADITIRSNEGKTFLKEQLPFELITKVDGVQSYSQAIEEVVVVKHEKKWVNARLIGVDTSFLRMSAMPDHLIEGKATLGNEHFSFALIGASLLDKLGGFIPEKVGYEQVLLYAPKRSAKVKLGSNPFNIKMMNLSGRFNYNREVNAEMIVVPIHVAQELLNYDKDLTAIYVDVKDRSNERVKEELQEKLGERFVVKTNYEKNELIFKTSKSEKMVVLIILIFIFILAAFNLIASLTMLFVEKEANIHTLISFGADRRMIFNIFFFEGLLISFKGIIIGLVLGYAVCLLQIKFELLSMPNSGGEAFPIGVNWRDGLMITTLVSALSIGFSYLPIRYLLKRKFPSGAF